MARRPVHLRLVESGGSRRWGQRIVIQGKRRNLEAFELCDAQWVLIASAKDDDPICIRPFDAITFSLGDLWS